MSPTAHTIPGVPAGDDACAAALDTLTAMLATPSAGDDAHGDDLDAALDHLAAASALAHSRDRRTAGRADRLTLSMRIADAEDTRDLAYFAEAWADDTGRALADADADLAHLHHLAHHALMRRDVVTLARVADLAAATLRRLADLDTGYLTAAHRHANRLRLALPALATRVTTAVRRLLATLRAAGVIASHRLPAAPGVHSTARAAGAPPPPPFPTCPHTIVRTLLTAPQAPPARAAARV